MNFLTAVGFMAACLFKPQWRGRRREKILELQVWCCFFLVVAHITKSGVRLTIIQKPKKSQVRWKGKFALCRMPTTREGEVGLLSESRLPPPHRQRGKSFYRQKEVAPCRSSSVSPDGRPEIGHVVV